MTFAFIAGATEGDDMWCAKAGTDPNDKNRDLDIPSKLARSTFWTDCSVATSGCSRQVCPLSLRRTVISRCPLRRDAKCGTSRITGLLSHTQTTCYAVRSNSLFGFPTAADISGRSMFEHCKAHLLVTCYPQQHENITDLFQSHQSLLL